MSYKIRRKSPEPQEVTFSTENGTRMKVSDLREFVNALDSEGVPNTAHVVLGSVRSITFRWF